MRQRRFCVGAILTLLTPAAAVIDAGALETREIRVPTREAATIQRALDLAASGDTIIVAPGTYVADIPLDFNRLRDPRDPAAPPVKDVVLRSEEGPEFTTLEGSITLRNGETAASVLSGFTIRGERDATFTIDAALTVNDCIVEIPAVFRGDPMVEGCLFQSTLSLAGAATLNQCELQHRLLVTGAATVRKVTMSDVVLSGRATSTFDQCHLRSLSTTGGSQVSLSECTISQAVRGIAAEGDTSVQLRGCVIRECRVAIESIDASGIVSEGSTIAGNVRGIVAGGDRLEIRNSIVWNQGEDVVHGENTAVEVAFSCVGGESPWPGPGNQNSDPLFCGWGSETERIVATQAELDSVLADFSLSLSAQSPCRRSGQDGDDMGAVRGDCQFVGPPGRRIQLGSGHFDLSNMVHGFSIHLVGSGDATALDAVSLRGDMTLENVRVLRRAAAVIGRSRLINTEINGLGVLCYSDAELELQHCEVSGAAIGVECRPRSKVELSRCRIERCTQGIVVNSQAKVDLVDCIVTQNSALYRQGPALHVSGLTTLTNCTISANDSFESGVIFATRGSQLQVLNSIVVDNVGGSLTVDPEAEVAVSFSCIAGDTVWPGTGNFNVDPRFCGWRGAKREFFVDAAVDDAGANDGSRERPFPSITAALSTFDYALAADSPCLGSGLGGTDVGARLGTCERSGRSSALLNVAPGTYEAGNLVQDVGVVGSTAGETIIRGEIRGLRSSALLSRITSMQGSVRVSSGESPEISASQIENLVCESASAPTVSDCTISQGSGVWCQPGSAPEFRRSTFAANSRQEFGGAVMCEEASPVFIDCEFDGNVAERGGAIAALQRSNVRVERCRFVRNRAASESVPNKTIGGALFVTDGSNVELSECLLLGGEAARGGALFSDKESRVTLSHCTVVENVTSHTPGGIAVDTGVVELESCIVWANTGVQITSGEGGQIHVRRSCIEGDAPWPGAGNINSDPLFCGFGAVAEVVVDPELASVANRPRGHFATLADAFSVFSLALGANSPCLGSGADGSDMGVPLGLCVAGTRSPKRITLRPGRHEATTSVNLAHGISLRGVDRDATVVAGSLRGLRTGARLENVTVSGGPVSVASGEQVELENCNFTSSLNSVDVTGGAAVLTGCRFDNNRIGLQVTADGSATVADCEFVENSIAAIVIRSELTIDRSEIRRNRGNERPFAIDSGVIHARNARLGVNRSLIESNRCGNGGAIGAIASRVNVRSSILRGNEANGSGGAIFSTVLTELLVESSLFVANSAADGGGAISDSRYGDSDTTMRLVNCTFADNHAGGQGDDLQLSREAHAEIVNCVFWGQGDDLLRIAIKNNARFSHSIVAGRNVPEGIGNLNVNPRFIRRGTFDFTRVTDDHIADFIIDPGDYRLQIGSPAIDAGVNAGAPEFDLDDRPRRCGDSVDLGAYESSCSTSIQFRRGDCNGDGDPAKLDDALFLLAANFAGGEAPICRAACDANSDGRVEGDVSDAVLILRFAFTGGASPQAPFPDCGSLELDGDLLLGCRASPCE